MRWLAPAGVILKGKKEDGFTRERVIDGLEGHKQFGNVNVAIVTNWVS